MVASTNFLDRLDPGLSKRPSRFDRKYKFPRPDEHERVLYCEYWHRKLKSNDDIEFPKKLCPPMAAITDGFSFAFLQECFVATLLVLARNEEEEDSHSSLLHERRPKPFDGDNDDLEDYKLWVAFKKQAHLLRKEVEGAKQKSSQLSQWLKAEEKSHESPKEHSTMAREGPSHHTCCKCSSECEGLRGREIVRSGKTAAEILPDLPWNDQKKRYFNSAVYEMRR